MRLFRHLIFTPIVAILGLSAWTSHADDAQQSLPTPTFASDVAPILQQHCQNCHRPGQIAPMSLLTYEESRPWAKSIREAVAGRSMPPWHAEPIAHAYSNDRSLNATERETVIAWVDGGAPMGDASKLPPPVKFTNDWQIKNPDLVIGMAEEFKVPAEGDDIYQCFVLDPGLTEDTWVDTVQIRPGAAEVSHHVVLYVDKQGVGDKLDAKTDEQGYSCFGGPGFQASMLGGAAPNGRPRIFPEGTGHLVPAGAKIIMQMHYHPAGEAVTDRTEIALHYAEDTNLAQLHDAFAIDFAFEIPPGAANYERTASRKILRDITVFGVAPHMHLLGKHTKMWAVTPKGEVIELVNVPRYRFDWQTNYIFEEPIKLPARSRIFIHGGFDNTAENPNQPSSPPRTVKFGEQTTDEMLVGVYYYVEDRNLVSADTHE